VDTSEGQRSAGSAIDWLKRWVADEPWSARCLAVVGLLLAVVSGIDQFGKQPDWYESASKVVSVVLTVLLVLISDWFASDVRRVKQWSEVSDDLQARLGDLESMHPDSLAAAGTRSTTKRTALLG
jgi:nicotinamide riboside transporter PnuC